MPKVNSEYNQVILLISTLQNNIANNETYVSLFNANEARV